MATRLEGLIRDEANDESIPEELFLTAVDEALELRRFSRIEKHIRQGISHYRPAATTNTGRPANPTTCRYRVPTGPPMWTTSTD